VRRTPTCRRPKATSSNAPSSDSRVRSHIARRAARITASASAASRNTRRRRSPSAARPPARRCGRRSGVGRARRRIRRSQAQRRRHRAPHRQASRALYQHASGAPRRKPQRAKQRTSRAASPPRAPHGARALRRGRCWRSRFSSSERGVARSEPDPRAAPTRAFARAAHGSGSTFTGTLLSVTTPVPSCPLKPSPQQIGWPVVRTAQK